MATWPPRLRLFVLLSAASILPLLALPLLGLASPAALWVTLPVLVTVWPVATALARPLEDLLAVVRRMRAGELHARTVLADSPAAEIAQVLFDLASKADYLSRTLEEQVSQRTATLARKADQLRAVGQVGQQVAAVLEPRALLQFVVRVMRGTFGYDLVAVLQRHDTHLVLAAGAARGVEEITPGRIFPLRDAAHISFHPDLTAQSELAVPLRVGDRVLGVLVAQSRHPDAFHAEDRFTVETIAGQVAVALENARLLEAERQLRDLSITAERNRMAREIHDTLAQGFMGIIMQLRAMQGESEPARIRFHREQAELLARESLQEARRSVWNLRPQPLEGQGLAGALQQEVAALAERTGLHTAFTVAGDVSRLHPTLEAALLRIAQEALHNASKHARARTLAVHLAVADEQVVLRVTDDGTGFTPTAVGRPPESADSGFGLHGMAERTRLLGGTLTIDTAPGQGCQIRVCLPLAEA